MNPSVVSLFLLLAACSGTWVLISAAIRKLLNIKDLNAREVTCIAQSWF